MKKKFQEWLTIPFLLLLLLAPTCTLADDAPIGPPDSIEQSLIQVATSLENLRTTVKTQEDPAQVAEIKYDIKDLEEDFLEIASGLNFSNVDKKETNEAFSWNQELQIVLSPIISELKEISSRPREIDGLKKEIAKQESDLEKTNVLLNKLSFLKKTSSNELLNKYIKAFEKDWKQKKSETITELTIVRQRLAAKQAEKKSLAESIGGIFDLFFKSRGRNLLLSIGACLSFVAILRLLFNLCNFLITRSSSGRKVLYQKILKISHYVLSIAGVIIVFAAALFYMEDWLLLILTGLMILGVLWSSKQILPRFWAQAVLILNSGAVREHERVEYLGIPYRVRKINFYSILVNPELEGGVIRLPINDLTSLRSRPANSEEPWFPTRKHDWIFAPNQELFGQVILQSPSTVTVRKPGGSRVQFRSEDFLKLNFANLSEGFRISVSFTLDYQHQKDITQKIPNTFARHLEEKFKVHHLADLVKELAVSLDKALDSSLRLAILVDFHGKAAADYQKLQRTLNMFCIEICNQEDYQIPFPQLDVHLTNGAKFGVTQG